MAENSCETSFQTYQGVCRIRVEVTIKIKRGYGVREGRMCKWGAIGKSSQQADVCGQAVVAASASSFRWRFHWLHPASVPWVIFVMLVSCSIRGTETKRDYRSIRRVTRVD